jgi:thiol:disulfide interchange protein DsbA
MTWRLTILGCSFVLLGACGNDAAPPAGGETAAPATASAPYREGEHYQRIDPPLPAADNEIVEVFSYACPACAQFQPEVDAWKRERGDAVTLRYVPAEFSPGWIPFAQAFHTAQAMGTLGRLHRPIFDALYRQGRRAGTLNEIAEIVAAVGVDPTQFLTVSQSPEVVAAGETSRTYVRDAGVGSTPTMIVAGRYRVERKQPDGVKPLAVVDWLLENRP